MWDFREYQKDMVVRALPVFKKNNMVYLTGQERVGKTGAAIGLVNELKIKGVKKIKVLVITKRSAFSGWIKALNNFPVKFDHCVCTYGTTKNQKFKPDIVILDESHNYISAVPKPGKTWKYVYKKVFGKPIIYVSATPHAQGYHMLYHQFKLSKWSPWASYQNYYDWYKVYAKRDAKGNTETIWINSRPTETYTCLQDKLVKSCVDHLFITMTRKEAGFKYEPVDKVHYVKLAQNAAACAMLSKKRVLSFTLDGEEYLYDADTVTKLRTALHQLEGGTLKMSDECYLVLNDQSKIDYIKSKFKDDETLAIMYNFKAEKIKLEKHFKKAKILQATANAEGIDLYDYEHLVIYSQDYSVARHTQRRARQANLLRETPIVVHHILVEKGISHQVYNTVCVNKKNFVDSRFNPGALNYV